MNDHRRKRKYAFRSVTEQAIPAPGDWWACFGALGVEDLVVWPIVGWAILRREMADIDRSIYKDCHWEEVDYPHREWMPMVATPHDPFPWLAEDVTEFMATAETGFEFLGCFRGEMSPGFRDEAMKRMAKRLAELAADADQQQ